MRGAPARGQGLNLAPLKGLAPAHSLDLGGLRLGPLSAGIIAKLITTFKPDLPALRVDNNPIMPAGMAVLAECLKSSEDIRELHARYCAIGPEGTKSLAQMLKVNSSLEYVCILGNQIGDEGAEALMAVVAQSNLKQLEVQDNLISPKVKLAFADACVQKKGLKLLL